MAYRVGGSGFRKRAGLALMAVVLFSLALLLLGHAALLLARTEVWIATLDGQRVASEYRSRSAVLTLVHQWDSLPEPGTHPTSHGPVEARRLSREVALLRSVAPDRMGSAWESVLFRPHPGERIRVRDGGLQVGGSVFDPLGGITRSPEPEPCPAGAEVWTTTPPLLVARVSPDVLHPALGPLDLVLLERLLPELAGAEFSPVHDSTTACVEGGSGWGDPVRPSTGCTLHWGEGARSGDLVFDGAGQGVLAVSGDLTLATGSSFRGWVWVGGDLRLDDGATLWGLADVAGGAMLHGNAVFRVDACSAARALHHSRGLARPLPVGPSVWPAF